MKPEFETKGDLRRAVNRIGGLALAVAGLTLLAACGSASNLDIEEAQGVATQAVGEEASGLAPDFIRAEELQIVRTEEGRMRSGEPAWIVVFSRPPSSEIGCVWISRPDDYAFEIDRCPAVLEGASPPGPVSSSVRSAYELAFEACRAGTPQSLAVAYGVPARAPTRVIARAVSGEAAGLLDLDGRALRGCLAGMKYRQSGRRQGDPRDGVWLKSIDLTRPVGSD